MSKTTTFGIVNFIGQVESDAVGRDDDAEADWLFDLVEFLGALSVAAPLRVRLDQALRAVYEPDEAEGVGLVFQVLEDIDLLRFHQARGGFEEFIDVLIRRLDSKGD